MEATKHRYTAVGLFVPKDESIYGTGKEIPLQIMITTPWLDQDSERFMEHFKDRTYKFGKAQNAVVLFFYDREFGTTTPRGCFTYDDFKKRGGKIYKMPAHLFCEGESEEDIDKWIKNTENLPWEEETEPVDKTFDELFPGIRAGELVKVQITDYCSVEQNEDRDMPWKE